MTFTPLNRHIEVEPIEEESIIAQQNATYEEKGKVISVAVDCERFEANEVGTIVYFDAWLCAKHQDSEGKTRWLVPEDAIRAYESL